MSRQRKLVPSGSLKVPSTAEMTQWELFEAMTPRFLNSRRGKYFEDLQKLSQRYETADSGKPRGRPRSNDDLLLKVVDSLRADAKGKLSDAKVAEILARERASSVGGASAGKIRQSTKTLKNRISRARTRLIASQ